ncbi:acyl-CoA thioesterase [Sulfitobacter sp. JBTF-M27]|uniref:Acyl-CoA thioesterase n=1 Tax=Sulfitobacter sediminilitoris TaxID=2698830 RepID=A0A6P0CIH7_9RHOB|nr:thioesterase family protein [Sulfitobacter sediminilitoris]NEK25210.1 acyl-CoA thioesterase [Sulfitobacter sediminilitoris]
MGGKTPITTRTDYADFYPLQTRGNDNDIYGHMNNVVHYSLFDTAVNGWLMEHGLLDPRTSDTFGLVVETGCKYHAEMGFPDKVTAGLRVARLGSSSIRYEVALFRNDEDTATAEGHFVHVYVNRETHRPSKIEDNRRAAFQSLMTVEAQ